MYKCVAIRPLLVLIQKSIKQIVFCFFKFLKPNNRTEASQLWHLCVIRLDNFETLFKTETTQLLNIDLLYCSLMLLLKSIKIEEFKAFVTIL